jgi:hypothetical protein
VFGSRRGQQPEHAFGFPAPEHSPGRLAVTGRAELSVGLYQRLPDPEPTERVPPTAAEQLDAAARYMAARYGAQAAAIAEGYQRAAEQFGAQLAAFGRTLAEGLALLGAARRVGTERRGDPTGDPPLGGST